MQDNFRILKPFLRGLPIIVFAMIISVIAAKKYLSYVTPMYESTAKLKLADVGTGIPYANLYKDFDVFASSTKIAGEIEVLKSSQLLSKALSSLDFNLEISRVGTMQSTELYNNSPISILLAAKSGKVYDKKFKLTIQSNSQFEIFNADETSLLKGQLDKPIAFLDNVITISKNEKVIAVKKDIKINDNYEFEFLSPEKLLEKIEKNLDIVSIDKDVPVIRINLKSNIPEKACVFVNKLAETYIYDYIESKFQAANTTVSFLDNQIKEASSKLSESENKIENYRNENDIVNIKQETETDLRKISQLKIQQTNLKMSLEAIEELNRYISSGKENFLTLAPNFEAFTDLLSTEIIKNIKKLQADKKDLLLTYTANDERVKVIDEKIKDLTSYLIESIKNTKVNLQVKYDEITRDINQAEQVFETVPLKEKNMTIMTRDFDLLQQSYNFLNEKKIEAEIAQSAKISFHRVITPATIAQKPISPNRPIIIILSAILGMLFSIAAIYTVHFLKAKVNDVVSIETNSSIPVAVSTTFNETYQYKAFQKTVLQLELKHILAKGKILTMTSYNKNEGRGYNLINICKTLSLQQRSVLVIDVQGDLDTLQNNPLEFINYISIASPKFDCYSNEQLQELIMNAKYQADFVIINNEFLKEESRALLMMKIADANLFVVDARNTALKLINRLELLNAEFDIQNLSFLLNKMGHNPSVVKEIITWIKKHILKKYSK